MALPTMEEIRKISNYSDQILEVVDNREDYTRSDLQARIEAIVTQIVREK